ncbi:MAG: cation diffusion facilitator family transporter [Caulobacteraceae bacterium]|nr:cation diffusion facilitator family transporter [Caulobacteraceae bacterium]
MTAATASALTIDETAALTRRVTRLSVAVASILSVLKALAWLSSGSVAMLASLADSSLDLLASLVTYFAVRYAVAPPDREHRFGHGKAEAFASLVQGGLVFASAALVAREAADRIAHPAPVANGLWGLAVMAVSIGLTSGLLVAQARVLRQANSVAVSGDHAHYAADLASNLIAGVGIAASAVLGSSLPDALSGLVVVAWLVWGAISVFRQASTELMDHELADESRRRIVELMTEDPQVRDIHQLRTRASGPYVHIQMHADLDPQLSLVQAHQVMVAAEKRVLEAFPSADIIIHPDPRGVAEPHGGAFPEVHHPESAHES